MTDQHADDVAVDQALSLLWHAARISPHLRQAVEIVEQEIQRTRRREAERP
jgi:hypothetical protein